jgi:hypothetical protein
MELGGQPVQLFLAEKLSGDIQHSAAALADKVGVRFHPGIEMLLPIDDPHTHRFPRFAELLQIPVHGAQAQVGIAGLQFGIHPVSCGMNSGFLKRVQNGHPLPAEIFAFFQTKLVPFFVPFLSQERRSNSPFRFL